VGLAREVISLDSSSDEFVPSSNSQSDASDQEMVYRKQNLSVPTKRRRLKRVRRAESDSNSGDDVSRNPRAVEALPPSASQSDEWECTRCTYLNASEILVCEICLTTRSKPRPTRKLSAWLTTPAASKPKRKGTPTASIPIETIDSSDEGESSGQHATREKPTPHPKTTPASSTLWSESTHAQHMDDLCVQKKKVQEVQEWLHQSVPSRVTHRQHHTKRLLFLCGPPGSGKSTTVRHLASAMGLEIKEWEDNASAGKLQYQRHLRDEFQVAYVSAWDDFIDFINRSVNYSALQLATVLPVDRKRSSAQTQRTSEATAQGQLILLESWPQHLHGSGQDSTVWDEKLTAAFRQVVNPAANLQYPVVCIFSDVRDKKVDVTQLAKIFSEEVVRSPFTSIINFNPVTAGTVTRRQALVRKKTRRAHLSLVPE
jgi:hypothetical protein